MTAPQPMLAFLENLGFPELLVIGIIALLIFGRRLPEVGRSLGKSFVEFKKGLKETGDELRDAGDEIKQIKSDVKNAGTRNEQRSSEDQSKFNDPNYKEPNTESVHS